MSVSPGFLFYKLPGFKGVKQRLERQLNSNDYMYHTKDDLPKFSFTLSDNPYNNISSYLTCLLWCVMLFYGRIL